MLIAVNMLFIVFQNTAMKQVHKKQIEVWSDSHNLQYSDVLDTWIWEKNGFKTESIKKLSNFNFQWTKTLYQNNLNNIAFFFTFFKGYRCN